MDLAIGRDLIQQLDGVIPVAMILEEPYFPRPLGVAVTEALTDTPVVCLLGPRQCGKSTLVRRFDPGRAYITLDDANFLNAARQDPQGFLSGLPERVTIDEIQRVPELLLAIKHSIDTDRRAGRYLLTGSANLLEMPRLADSLAGRMEFLYLSPLTEAEKERAPGGFLKAWLGGKLAPKIEPSDPLEPSDLPARLTAGGYPEPLRRGPGRARQWHRQYLKAIIERDIQEVGQVKDGRDVGRLLEFLSHQTAGLLNVSSTANELGMARDTVERHLAILEKLFLIRRLPAWHKNSAKRLVKTPKIHVCDSGLAATLAGLSADEWITRRERFGHLMESFVVQQLMAQAAWTDPELRFWHYRDKDQEEVDCVIMRGNKVWGVEVKTARTADAGDARGLRRLADQTGDHFAGGIVIYAGNSILPLREGEFLAVPASRLWRM